MPSSVSTISWPRIGSPSTIRPASSWPIRTATGSSGSAKGVASAAGRFAAAGSGTGARRISMEPAASSSTSSRPPNRAERFQSSTRSRASSQTPSLSAMVRRSTVARDESAPAKPSITHLPRGRGEVVLDQPGQEAAVALGLVVLGEGGERRGERRGEKERAHGASHQKRLPDADVEVDGRKASSPEAGVARSTPDRPDRGVVARADAHARAPVVAVPRAPDPRPPRRRRRRRRRRCSRSRPPAPRAGPRRARRRAGSRSPSGPATSRPIDW